MTLSHFKSNDDTRQILYYIMKYFEPILDFFQKFSLNQEFEKITVKPQPRAGNQESEHVFKRLSIPGSAPKQTASRRQERGYSREQALNRWVTHHKHKTVELRTYL